MTTCARSFGFLGILVVVCLIGVTPTAVAQQQANEADNQDIYGDYYASVKSLQNAHQKALAAIDEYYRSALLEYRSENVDRARSLSEQNLSAHKMLGEQGLTGAQRQAEAQKIQAADKKRRAEYAEWRDSTAQKLREDHAKARSAQIEQHQAQMDALLADRNAKLAGIRALDGTIGLTPGATAALGNNAPGALSQSHSSGEDGATGETESETGEGNRQRLDQYNEGQAGIRSADHDSDTASDTPESSSGLEVLERVNDKPTQAVEPAGDPVPIADEGPPSRLADNALPQALPPANIGDDDVLGGRTRSLPAPADIEPQAIGTRIAIAFPTEGDLVEITDSGASAQPFEMSVTTALTNTVSRFNFRVVSPDGTVVLQNDVCGAGAASQSDCGNNPRFNALVDLRDVDPGIYRLAVQALDNAGDAVSRVVEFQIPYHAVIATDVDVASAAEETESNDCTWTVSGRLVDWNGNAVASRALTIEARRNSKNRVREHREWSSWNSRKWGAVTTDSRGHFNLRSQKLDHCGGKREFRVRAEVGVWTLNLGQELLSGQDAVIPNPLILPRAESRTTFDIITYNIAMIAGGDRDRKYRAETMGKRLHRYPVVVLNEALRNRGRRNLLRELRETWMAAGYTMEIVGDGRPALDNGGVDIVTRLPLVESHDMEYSEERGSDRLADKGALHARVRTDNGQLIDIFATHLQAGDRPGTRAHQLSELRDFIRRHADPDVPFLVLGDMNLKNAEEQNTALLILREARDNVVDAWQWRGSGACVTRPKSGRCLDYIYVANVSGERPLALDRIAIREFEDAATRRGYLSDHFGVEAGFTVSPIRGRQ